MLIRRVLRIVTSAASARYLHSTIPVWSAIEPYDTFGGSGTSETDAYLQFPIDVPAGTQLASATLELTPQSDVSGTTAASIGTLALYSGDLATDRHAVDGASLPQAWSVGAWTANTRGSSTRVDITSLVQAVIDREAYAPGDLVTLAISATGGSLRPFWAFDGEPNKAPTLGLVYDDGVTPFAPASDVIAMCNTMGESITYTPSHGAARTIKAIIDRGPRETLDGMGMSHGPGLTLHVANHPTSGISSAEIDTATDTITLPARYGRSGEVRSILGVSDHDFGALMLEVS